jgi:DNA-binding HxlR family transcriptional regulator
MWTMLALRDGPQPLTRLFDGARSLDGPIGHGTLMAAVARLERLGLVERTVDDRWGPAYRLTRLGTDAAGLTRPLA